MAHSQPWSSRTHQRTRPLRHLPRMRTHAFSCLGGIDCWSQLGPGRAGVAFGLSFSTKSSYVEEFDRNLAADPLTAGQAIPVPGTCAELHGRGFVVDMERV